MAISEVLSGSEFDQCVSTQNGKPFFRMDIGECGQKEMWGEYCDIVDGLKKFGLVLVDANVEHDCISGFIECGL